MGAFLLSAGTKGKRFSLPNSRIMIHQPLGGGQGTISDLEIQANEMLHEKENPTLKTTKKKAKNKTEMDKSKDMMANKVVNSIEMSLHFIVLFDLGKHV
ncbi:hypothetical protein K1719_018567 [Acacia pycnantha]|nr:hypothetical protein K1719_018567 [Acacia pycnantha]